MQREEFLKKLSVVAPALSDNSLIPVLTHFWFLGDRVMAFNDKIAISTPCETEFRGAVPGAVLLQLLNASVADTIKMRIEGPTLIISAGKSSAFKLPMLPESSFVFEIPEPKDTETGSLKMRDFCDRLEICMKSVSNDTSIPDQLGVTLIPGKSDLTLYSTNNATLSAAFMKVKELALGKRVILSGVYCKELLSLAKGSEEGEAHFEANDKYSLFKRGETVLWGRLIYSSHPLDFDGIIDRHFPHGEEDRLIEIPKELEGVLSRAIVIAESSSIDKGSTEIRSGDDGLLFETKSDRGHVKDVLDLDFPGVRTRINPRFVKNGLDSFTHILITDKAIILSDKNATSFYLIGATGG